MAAPAVRLAPSVAAPTPALAPTGRFRLESVDVVRGLIMIIMALDHTRDYFTFPGQDPTDLSKATAALFMTRWITHFCAPVFFLLTGTGAYLSLRKKSPSQLSRYLLTRGLWLLFLEAVVMRCFAYQFNFDYRVTLLIVLWALGWSMIALSVLVRLPTAVVATIGAILIVGHNLFDGVKWANPLWTILHAPGFLLNTPAHVVFVTYPLIPWIGVTGVGYALGQSYDWDAERRRTFLVRLGLALSVAFVALRAINVYGDPSRWSAQSTALFTVLSFLNTTKYPPSLLFLLMTLGPALLLLRAFDGGTPRVLRPALVIGKVPLFYFMLHFALIHLFAVIVCYVRYGTAHWMFESPDLANYPFITPPEWGYPLPIVYLVWAAVVLTMYPLCRWFAALKQRRRDPWLSYL
ncbi:MAG: heparan-alpha-glucosaminide N-acetyltransferase domain-containing protein [Gemmatimonadota bacterium]|nr:heparan-alpha-glucosaminide N-acetyltransferase domain-containing protein [Gemmatimonadota bacterium]